MNVAPRKDGNYAEQATTNTVWDLRPIPFVAPNASDPTGPRADRSPDTSTARGNGPSARLINGQVNPGPIDGRVDGRAPSDRR